MLSFLGLLIRGSGQLFSSRVFAITSCGGGGEKLEDISLRIFHTVCCDPHSQRLWHSQKAEVDVFLKLCYFFNDPADVDNLISGSSAFSKSSLNIWKFMVHVLLKPGLENFEHYFTSVCC